MGLSQTPPAQTSTCAHMASKASDSLYRSKSSCIFWTWVIFRRVMKPLANLCIVTVAFKIIYSTCLLSSWSLWILSCIAASLAAIWASSSIFSYLILSKTCFDFSTSVTWCTVFLGRIASGWCLPAVFKFTGWRLLLLVIDIRPDPWPDSEALCWTFYFIGTFWVLLRTACCESSMDSKGEVTPVWWFVLRR